MALLVFCMIFFERGALHPFQKKHTQIQLAQIQLGKINNKCEAPPLE